MHSLPPAYPASRQPTNRLVHQHVEAHSAAECRCRCSSCQEWLLRAAGSVHAAGCCQQLRRVEAAIPAVKVQQEPTTTHEGVGCFCDMLLLLELLEGVLERHAELGAAWLAGSQQGAFALRAKQEPAASSRRESCQHVLPHIGDELAAAARKCLTPQQQRLRCFCGDCRPPARQLSTQQNGVGHAAQIRRGEGGLSAAAVGKTA